MPTGTMKSVRCHRTGGPEVLQLDTVSIPVPGPGQVLLRVEAAGVNYADTLRRAGKPYPVPSPLPFNPGAEVAGAVCGLGAGVPAPWLGRRALATAIHGGGYAQYLVLPHEALLPCPDGLSSAQAVTLLVQGITAGLALRESGGLSAGDRVLIHGATGGVGSLALQLARALGASCVIAGVGSEAKRDRALSFGAHVAVDYSQPDWPASVLQATAGEGVDLVLDATSGALLRDSVTCLAAFGRLVVYGTADPLPEPVPLPGLIARNQRVIGCFLGGYFQQRPHLAVAWLETLATMVRQGQITLHLHDVLPLAEAAQAHRLMEERRVAGKLVLDPWR